MVDQARGEHYSVHAVEGTGKHSSILQFRQLMLTATAKEPATGGAGAPRAEDLQHQVPPPEPAPTSMIAAQVSRPDAPLLRLCDLASQHWQGSIWVLRRQRIRSHSTRRQQYFDYCLGVF